MGFHRQYVEPADPLELDPPTLKCAIPRFQRGPYYYHRSGWLCKFVTSFANFFSAASNLLELNYSIFFNTFQDACLILLGLEMMHGWYEILNSGCKMCDFAKFCRLRDIQPTRVP